MPSKYFVGFSLFVFFSDARVAPLVAVGAGVAASVLTPLIQQGINEIGNLISGLGKRDIGKNFTVT